MQREEQDKGRGVKEKKKAVWNFMNFIGGKTDSFCTMYNMIQFQDAYLLVIITLLGIQMKH